MGKNVNMTEEAAKKLQAKNEKKLNRLFRRWEGKVSDKTNAMIAGQSTPEAVESVKFVDSEKEEPNIDLDRVVLLGEKVSNERVENNYGAKENVKYLYYYNKQADVYFVRKLAGNKMRAVFPLPIDVIEDLRFRDFIDKGGEIFNHVKATRYYAGSSVPYDDNIEDMLELPEEDQVDLVTSYSDDRYTAVVDFRLNKYDDRTIDEITRGELIRPRISPVIETPNVLIDTIVSGTKIPQKKKSSVLKKELKDLKDSFLKAVKHSRLAKTLTVKAPKYHYRMPNNEFMIVEKADFSYLTCDIPEPLIKKAECLSGVGDLRVLYYEDHAIITRRTDVTEEELKAIYSQVPVPVKTYRYTKNS